MEFRHVTQYRDRHGKVRFRFRRAGYRPHGFRSEFGTPAFAQEYAWVIENKRADLPPKRWDCVPLHTMKGVDLIYFVTTKRGPVKIGRTNNLESRLIRLQTSHPDPLQLLAVMPGGAAEEAALHRQFASSHIRGEWFRRTDEMMALIRANKVTRWRTELATRMANPK